MHSANPNCIKVHLVNLLLLVLFHLDTHKRLQSLDMRCRGSSAVFSQKGVGYSWLLNESLRHMLMLVCLIEFISFGKLEFIAQICLISAYSSVPDSPSQEQMIFNCSAYEYDCCGISSLHDADCEQGIVRVCQH